MGTRAIADSQETFAFLNTFMEVNYIISDSRLIPFILSCATLTFQAFRFAIYYVRGERELNHGPKQDAMLWSSGFFQSLIKHAGGKTLISFMITRLFGSALLFGLSMYSARGCPIEPTKLDNTYKNCPELFLTTTFVYTTILSFISLFPCVGNTWSTRSNVIILLSVMGVYTYRDIWALATYTEFPMDEAEGPLLYMKIAILALTSLAVPLLIPRRYTPIDPKNPMQIPNPEHTASIFSMMTYTFVDPIIRLGSRIPHLSVDQMFPLSDRDNLFYRTKKAFPYFDHFQGAKRRSLFWALIQVNCKDYAMMLVAVGGYSFGSFASPIAINRLLHYLETGGFDAKIRPWFWLFWLFVGPIVQSLSMQWYSFISKRLVVRIEGLITQLVLEHSLRIRMHGETNLKRTNRSSNTFAPKDAVKSATQNLTGRINNLVTTDLNNIVGGRDFLMIGFYIPLQLTISSIFLYQVLGWSALGGIAVLIVLLPIPVAISGKLREAQVEKMKKTDVRIQGVAETVSILRMIKLFGWEKKISERLEKTRHDEIYWLGRVKFFEQTNALLGFLYPTLTMLVSYALHTLVMKEQLKPSTIFSSMTVFSMFKEQFTRLLIQAVEILQGKVSLDRVQEFLDESELIDSFVESTTTLTPASQATLTSEIGFKNATFAWSVQKEDPTLTSSSRAFRLRIDGELLFKRNSINLIIGPTGSGKTSMLMALLGEMHFIPSQVDSWFNLSREDGIAYGAQESWVQNDTIRNNILFRTPYDEERYNKVIYQCALEHDLALFDAGDATEVGERGITLSGGQKARVTLARAVYSKANTVLLDDVFASLDVHTSIWIIEKCFKGDFMQGRTIILVTHNIALTGPIADFIVTIGLDGRVKSQQTGRSLPSNHKEQLIEESANVTEQKPDIPSKGQTSDGKLTVVEEVAKGRVKWRSLKLLIASMGGNHSFIVYFTILSALVLAEANATFMSWFLGYWGSQYEGHDPSTVNAAFYTSIFASIAFLGFFLSNLGHITFLFASMRASKTINTMLMDSILSSTLRWLDETPTGRILARCTHDIRAIDNTLPRNGISLVNEIIGLLTKLSAVVLFTPLFLFPSIGIGMFGFYVGHVFLRAQLSVKRETSNALSPVLSHFSAVIHGLVSIRAYEAQDYFKEESMRRLNHYTRVARTAYNLHRWVGFRMDVIGAAFTSMLATYLVYGTSVGPSNTGFSLAMAAQMSQYILVTARQGNDLEVDSNSLERIQAYLDIEHEESPNESGRPPASWPTSGDLRVERLSARYSKGGPTILNEVSFHITAGQRVGIVGRTGSGKTSLTLALLRCILTEGTVYYDGIPTNSINLESLRSNITIIPQTPELLSGTLRQNLDPFDQNDDASLNNALRSAGLFSLQEEDGEAPKLTLDSTISGSGTNLSVGQRQILALARAIVRGSKLLIMDEATSAIDYKTDSIIQNTLRTELGNDVTVLTVAHRLQTVMDYDRIIVLENGKMVEFGSPRDLLQTRGSLFRGMVDTSEDKDDLYRIVSGRA